MSEDSLARMVAGLAPQLASDASRLLAPLPDRADVRSELSKTSTIIQFHEVPKPHSLCTVDGARITEKLYAADMCLAAATAANGSKVEQVIDSKPLVWGKMMASNRGNDRLTEAAMACLEASLIASLPHEVRIIDGGFITPLAGIREGITASSGPIRAEVVECLTDINLTPLSALEEIYSHDDDSRVLIAAPKSDSSRVYTKYFASQHGLTMEMGDRLIATQMLNPGELFMPLPLVYTHNHIEGHRNASDHEQEIFEEVDRVAEILKTRSMNDELYAFYFKPPKSHTVLRLEFFAKNATLAQEKAMYLAALVSQDTHPPHILEPFSQALADSEAKKVSVGAKALRNLIVKNLSPEQQKQYGQFLRINYRT